jgi:hypothetical protein
MAKVSAFPATEATIWPLSMARPNAAALCVSAVDATEPAGGVNVPPSLSTLPVPSAKVATWPAVDEPGPVTLPEPTGG